MAGLRFKLAELQREAQAFREMAADFLDPGGVNALLAFESTLEGLLNASGDRTLRIEGGPIVTKPSDGDYEPGDRRGVPTIFAKVDWTWDMRPVGQPAKKLKARQTREVEFCGAASARINLYDLGSPDVSIGMWRVEVGTVDSPGCYFHIQVLGTSDEPPFPGTVSIPRLPSAFMTPLAAVEYVLGELFQDRWAKEASMNRPGHQYWRALQGKRLTQMLRWQMGQLAGVVGSPWMALKAARPDDELFLA